MTDWKTIVDQHGQLVWATAWRLLGNPADALDCFQETFLEAIKVARREPVGDWGALLRHLATARALDLLRVRCRQRSRTEALADPDAVVSREADPSARGGSQRVGRAIAGGLGPIAGRPGRGFLPELSGQAELS